MTNLTTTYKPQTNLNISNEPKYVTLTLETRDFRLLISGAERDLRFSSGKGTWHAKRRLAKILSILNETLEKIMNKPESILQNVTNIDNYVFCGAEKKGEFLTLHWKKEEASS